MLRPNVIAAIATAAPLLPLSFTVFSIEELLMRLVQVLF